MIWKTAWKNVWRNKLRSLIVILSVTMGILAGVFSIAVMNGMIKQRVDSALNNEVAHLHISHKDFRSNLDIQYRMNDVDQLKSVVMQAPGAQAVCERIVLTGMVNCYGKATGSQIIGINPDEEKKVFTLNEKLIDHTGSYFDKKGRLPYAYIGEELAKELKVIRYEINDAVLDTLLAKELDQEIIDKLATLKGERFANNKLFDKAVKKIVTEKEWAIHGQVIRNSTGRFRKNAKLTITFLDKDNQQTGSNFRIAGLYNLPNNMYEKANVFVLADELRALTGIPEGESHQLIVKLDNLDQTIAAQDYLKEQFKELEILSWREISPDLAMATDMITQFFGIFMLIILAALAFGILNTMLMVVLERTKELGMLQAIGMNKRKVFNMIMLESIFLSFIGGGIGILASKFFIMKTAVEGFNLSMYAEAFEAMGYSAHIYPEIEPQFFGIIGILIIITGVVSSIYPAIKALKLNPADAVRTD